MIDPLNYLLNKLSHEIRCCHKCVYCNTGFFDSLESYSCDLRGVPIDEEEIDSRSCWRFVKRRVGVSLHRQIHETRINRIKRNWYKVIVAVSTVIGLVITLLKAFGLI